MRFLVQKNIWGEYGYDRFMDAVVEQNVSFQMVGSIPFTSEFDQEVQGDIDHCFGSTRFINVCREKGYHVFPTFWPAAFDPALFEVFPKDRWINGDGYVCKFGDLNITEPVFIKPYTEKFFTGLVVEDNSDLEKIQLSTSFIENEKEELIMVSRCVTIKEEVRFFVIGGQLITGSGYRKNGHPFHFKIDSSHPAWMVCKDLIKDIDFADGYVIDLGLVEDDWKIVELNNLNSSGFYESDTDAIVRALTNL